MRAVRPRTTLWNCLPTGQPNRVQHEEGSIPNTEGVVMTLDEVKKRFVEEVKLRGYDDKYIDKNEEREILQIAIQQGISVESARAALSQVCEAQAFVLESRVLGEIKDLIETFASNDGKIDEKEFQDAVTTLK